MFRLPKEIVQYIFEFDNTYKEKFTNILNQLQKPIILTFLNQIYYIFDFRQSVLHMTNDLSYPNYICTSYYVGYLEFLKIKKKYELVEIESVLQFDIDNFTFDNMLEA
jgi:hypothetical protein